MARYTLALGTEAQTSPLKTSVKLVNLHRDEHISEEYLSTINRKGQVPAMTGAGIKRSITDSLDISYFLSENYFPGLLGGWHETTVRQLLARLHSIQALSLSVSAEDRVDVLPCSNVDDLLARSDISHSYRSALTFKKKFFEENDSRALEENHVKQVEQEAKAVFKSVNELYIKNGSKDWIFGATIGPTVLDAHCIALIARLIECDHKDLVPGGLLEYAESHIDSRAWREVTHGRPTMWDVSIGHVALLSDI